MLIVGIQRIKDEIPHAIMEEHKKYINRLITEGKLIITGPFTDDGGGGMFIMDCDSQDEAKDLIHQDPLIQLNLAESEIRPYRMVFNRYQS